jgi:hypothetical protein
MNMDEHGLNKEKLDAPLSPLDEEGVFRAKRDRVRGFCFSSVLIRVNPWLNKT